jgi:hypothetical protein
MRVMHKHRWLWVIKGLMARKYPKQVSR